MAKTDLEDRGSNLEDEVKATKMDLREARTVLGGIDVSGDERSWMIPIPELSNLEEIVVGDTLFESAPSDIDDDTVGWSINASQLVKWDTQYIFLCKRRR